MALMARRLLRAAILSLVFLLSAHAALAQFEGGLFWRTSRASSFVFNIFNNGALYRWAQAPGGANDWFSVSYWPSTMQGLYMTAAGYSVGPAVLAKKNGKYLVSDASYIEVPYLPHRPFNQMVPGWIGDPRAGYDSTFHGPGWKYVNDPDYVVYSSMDYDSRGVDISGANYNDWPLRSVHGVRKYVADPLERGLYPPVYVSDEDLFCIFKDTDTEADPLYTGPTGPSAPIGIEVHHTIYTWGSGPEKDIVLLQYELINKSGVLLDSCHIVFAGGLTGISDFPPVFGLHAAAVAKPHIPLPNASKRMALLALHSDPTYDGYAFLDSPTSYDGNPAGLMRGGVPSDSITFFVDALGRRRWICYSNDPRDRADSIVYRLTVSPVPWASNDLPTSERLQGPVIVSRPFQMAAGETVRTVVSLMFSDSLGHLLAMDDYLRRMYASGYQRASAPPPPRLSARAMNRGVRLTWDTGAEGAVDSLVPTSLGRPFYGYRLLRADRQEGPYLQIGTLACGLCAGA